MSQAYQDHCNANYGPEDIPQDEPVMTLEQKAADMRNALDSIELALMGFEDNLLEIAELFETTSDDVIVWPKIKVGNLRQLATALAECNRIINSPEYNLERA